MKITSRRPFMLVGPLELGSSAPLRIREELVPRCPPACRLLYVSDVHLRQRRSARIAAQVVAAARASTANVVLLGGDLVDSASELGHLASMVEQLTRFGPVFAVQGNHDKRVGTARVRGAIADGGGVWIHDRAASVPVATSTISLAGPRFAGQPSPGFRVLCAHNPRIWRAAVRKDYDLVLAGHLHGCQFVAFQHRGRLFPGAFFYRCNYLRQQRGQTRLVVSRGVSDLVPIRWCCPREVVLCHG